MLKRIFPHPILTVVLLIVWLFLNNTIATGHIVLGLVLAILIPWLTSAYWPERNCIKKPFTLLKFLLLVLWDILVANLKVAVLILGKRANLKPGFITIELDVKTPLGISVLANVISLTPGTVSCDLSMDRQSLLVHALHIEDAQQIIDEIKQRYEKSIIEVFTAC
jgi:multicomponent K+:H+ antiporter subunit E